MATIGQQFKAAREAKGITEQEAGKATKILTKMIREMEADDFSGMAAPAYAKGFIRMYARYLGLDPEPLVEQYLQERAGDNEPPARSKRSGALEEQERGPGLGVAVLRTVLQAVGNWKKRLQAIPKHLPAVPKRLLEIPRRLPGISLQDIRVQAAVVSALLVLIVLSVGMVNCARRRGATGTGEQPAERPARLLLDEPLPDLYLVEPGHIERAR